jgi:hypothetical protein
MNSLLAYTDSASYFPGDTAKLYIHAPTKFGFADTIKLIRPNQNVILKSTNNNGDFTLNATINQNGSTPGISYTVTIDTQIVKIEWDISINGNFILNPHITDISGNKIYAIDYKINMIEISNNYIILSVPKNIQNLKIFLLARAKDKTSTFKKGDTFIINNLYLFNVVRPNNLNMVIELYNVNKKLLKQYTETNIVCQEFIKDSFAEGCRWKKTSELYIPSDLKSGYYFIKINYGSMFYVPLIIKSKVLPNQQDLQNTVLVLANTNTWNAYNTWGGLDGNFSAYLWAPLALGRMPERQDISSSKYIETSKYKTKDTSKYVANTLSYNRPDLRLNNEIINFIKNDITQTLFISHLIYGELYLILYLESLGLNYHVITDFDLHQIKSNEIFNYCLYNTIALHVHPEYWSEKMLYNFNLIYSFKKTNLLYLGGNAIYWKVVIDENKRIVEVRKNGSIHTLDKTPGGLYSKLFKAKYYLNNSNMLGIENILKIGYEETYSRTLENFNFPFVVNKSSCVLFRDFTDLLNNDLICKLNSNSNKLNSGASGWEVDKVHLPANIKYIIAESTKKTSNMIYVDDEDIKILSIGSITFTGSLLCDYHSFLIVKNFFIETKLIQ